MTLPVVCSHAEPNAGVVQVCTVGDTLSATKVDRLRRDLGSGHILITQHFNEKIITPGEDVSLQCAATADRPPRFIWERDGVVISSNTDQRYTLGQMMSPTGVGVISHLNITRTRVEDGGLYSCIALEGDQSASHVARLDIYGPPYIRSLPPIKVQSGEPLKLRCPYYGYPISKLEWEHKGRKIISSTLPQHARYKRMNTNTLLKKRKRKKRQIFEAGTDGVLDIPRVMKEENGDTYTCNVYSPSGEMARRSFEIQVVEAPELDELRVGSGLKEGQIVQITCNIISGDPPIYFSWLKDGKKIPANLRITERSSELFSVLIIKRVSLEHCGKYICIATNHVGKVNQTADLYINVAPKWVEEPTNTSLLLGQRGMVYCNANGYPSPQIHWMKRDATLGIWRPVLDLAGGGIMSYPNGTLVIEVVSLSDEGMYACNVENGIGEPLSKNLWISVNKPVHFDSVGTNLTTKMGLPVTLTCRPMGDNPIRVKWSVNASPVDFTPSSNFGITYYNLSWKEANGAWQDTWSNKGMLIQGSEEYTLKGLKCGTKYSLRMTAANSVGASQPTYVDATTLGGVPISPTSTEWFWSNASHIYIQLSGWDDNGCEISRWEVEYREYGSKGWKKAENRVPQIEQQWNFPSSLLSQPNSFVIADLEPAQWYQIRVTSENSAGISTSTYNYATTTLLGESIGPPSEVIDINMLVIICSSILLTICSLTCVYILVKRHNHQRLTEYRNSLTVECKSERSNVTANTPQSVQNDNNRVYSTPIHLPAENKHELYEISPYAQFAIGFRTFGHVDNQEVPTRMHLPGNSKSRYDSETSFQMRSESEESDCVSRTTTLKSAPRKACRVPHHR
ncbi:Down syndrome cell adhesion molecule-like protein Dscam2 [Hyposmocoma kahamanoa]|uniref:Down syndrome cell adhesion molecule-like protein Dscam2 n=1 Tax=Hyposmocoma kahamanoa TaxID=1477025 RepID=UPI000E6DA4CC|nr:Down syndrome cell adhesion molecule-like protein Dscam2 [Hyposmocoma kahamanoa]